MSSVSRRIKRNMGELETGRRGMKLPKRRAPSVNRRVERAEARLKAR